MPTTKGRIYLGSICVFGCNSGNDIGTAGAAGFGVGVYPNGAVPTGFAELTGTQGPTSDNYGTYQHTSDGSLMCWIPAFYYRIGSASSPHYATYGLNAVDIAAESAFATEAAATAAGYALHRAFKNGGQIMRGFMADKYQCSKHPTLAVASSLRNGNPLSSNSAHNPFSGLTGLTTADNYYHGAIKAAKTRGTVFHCMARFQWAALALLATAHGQAASGTTCRCSATWDRMCK